MLGDYSSLTRFCSPCIPKGVIRYIEGICKNFLWGQKADYLRAPPVTWDFVCRPKRAGGLGIINYELWNYAAIAKYLWYITKEKVC